MLLHSKTQPAKIPFAGCTSKMEASLRTSAHTGVAIPWIFLESLWGPMPSAAVRDEGALQMRPAPCGYSSARFLRPHSFLSLSKKERKKRIAAPGEERKEKPRNRKCPRIPKLRPSTAVAVWKGRRSQRIWSFRRPGGSAMQLASSDAAPHAILMMAVRHHFADTVCRGGRLCPPANVGFAV